MKKIKLRAAARLQARGAATEVDTVKNDLNRAMSIMLGKGLRVSVSEDGTHTTLTYRAPSTMHDVGASDLRRIETVMNNHHLNMNIAVSNGRLIFVFEALRS